MNSAIVVDHPSVDVTICNIAGTDRGAKPCAVVTPAEAPSIPFPRMYPSTASYLHTANVNICSLKDSLKNTLLRSIQRSAANHLIHMLARYPSFAKALFVPVFLLAALFFMMSDVVALLLALYALSVGLVFAAAGAREMVKDGFTFTASPPSNDLSFVKTTELNIT